MQGHNNEISNLFDLDLKQNDDKDLVYVSFGSISMNQIGLYVKLISALKQINEKKSIKAVIATGKKCYSYLKA